MISLSSSYKYKSEFAAVRKNEAKVLKSIKRAFKTSKAKDVLQKYYGQYKGVLKYAKYKIAHELKQKQTKKYEFMSAAISHLMPEIKEDQHFTFYFGLEKWRNLTYAHAQNPSMLKSVKNFSLDNKHINPERQTLYVTYKYGTNQSIIGYLLANNIKLLLLIDSKAYEERSYFAKLIEGVQKSFGTESPYEIINVEDPKSVLTISSYIKKGYSALAFIDGNTGSGGQYEKNSSMINVAFLNGKLLVRQGIAKLALMLKLPIVPILSFINEKEHIPTFEMFDPILFKANTDKKLQVKQATQKMWQILDQQIRKSPYQWDGWDRVHRFLNKEDLRADHQELKSPPVSITHSSLYSLNEERYRVFMLGKAHGFLFDRKTFETFEIEKGLYDLMSSKKKFAVKKYIKKGIKLPLLEELISKQVLIS